MLEMFLGTAGMLLVLTAFVAGFMFAKQIEVKAESIKTADAEMTPEEAEKQRKAMLAEQEAFREQMSYGVEAAYRIETGPEDGGLI